MRIQGILINSSKKDLKQDARYFQCNKYQGKFDFLFVQYWRVRLTDVFCENSSGWVNLILPIQYYNCSEVHFLRSYQTKTWAFDYAMNLTTRNDKGIGVLADTYCILANNSWKDHLENSRERKAYLAVYQYQQCEIWHFELNAGLIKQLSTTIFFAQYSD